MNAAGLAANALVLVLGVVVFVAIISGAIAVFAGVVHGSEWLADRTPEGWSDVFWKAMGVILLVLVLFGSYRLGLRTIGWLNGVMA